MMVSFILFTAIIILFSQYIICYIQISLLQFQLPCNFLCVRIEPSFFLRFRSFSVFLTYFAKRMDQIWTRVAQSVKVNENDPYIYSALDHSTTRPLWPP